MSHLIIAGAGGFGLEVAAYAKDMQAAGKAPFTIKGFLDDGKQPGSSHGGLPVLGNTDSEIDADAIYVIGVGAPDARQALAQKLGPRGATFATIIHPQSYVAESARMGSGSIIAPFAFVGPEASIGMHCVLNVHASAGHESRLEDFCVLSPYAGAHGGTILKSGAFMGSGSYVTAGSEIGANARIAAGAVVYNDIPNGVLALGNPARTKME